MLKLKIKIGLLVLTALLPITSQALTKPVNLGTIDIRLTNNQEEINLNVEAGKNYLQEIQISNFSNEKVSLDLFSRDAQNDPKNYLIKENTDKTSYLNKWIKLPTKKLTLESGESKIVSVNITIPELAPIGEQAGAIMISQKISSAQENLIIEKGLRVKLKVLGQAISSYKNIYTKTTSSEDSIEIQRMIVNNGNTIIDGNINIKTLNDKSEVVSNNSKKIFILPGEDSIVELATPKPDLGLYRTVLEENINNQTKTSVIEEALYFPSEAGAILIFIGYIALALIIKTKNLNPNNNSQLKLIGFFLILTLLSFNLNKDQSILDQIKSDLLNSTPETGYLTTIKWGNNQTTGKTSWKGKIKLNNSRLIITERLHQEKFDKFYLNPSEDTLLYENTTGPDNDGIVLFIKPENTADEVYLNYSNSFTKEDFKIPITRTINKPYSINYKGQTVKIQTIIAPETITYKKADKEISIQTKDFLKQTPIIVEQQSTTEILAITEGMSTPEIKTEIETSAEETPNNIDLQNELSLLREVISDIPSTAEMISEYILNSDYVEEVISENNTSTIKTDPSLISVLKETPLTIEEITQTPELNFVFLPNEKIKLSPQIFSFERENSTTQDFGEILFSQNRTSSWNAYMSVSDFTSISGRGTISASNVTIDPGIAEVISDQNTALIEEGKPHQLSSQSDQAVLVFVEPKDNNQNLFVLKPKITLKIPPKTPPGLYRGEITIRII